MTRECDTCRRQTSVPIYHHDERGRCVMVTCRACRSSLRVAERQQMAARLRLAASDGVKVGR